jgi:4-amino-4-deoxy-L-arabinose transferase-like glycosyltransferase
VLVGNVFLQQAYAWDEGGVMKAARLVGLRGFDGLREAYRDNAWLGPQHPPLPALIYGSVWALGGTDLLAMRLVAVAFGCVGILAAFRIGARLYGLRIGLLMAGLLLTTPLLVRVTSAATNDAQVFCFFCLAILFGLRVIEKPSDGRAFALGVVIGLGLLSKYTMVLVYPVLLALPWIVSTPPRLWRLVAIALVTSLAILGVWLIAADHLGVLGRQTERISHFAAGRSFNFPMRALFVRLPSALGVFALPVLLLGLLRCVRIARRAEALIVVWLAAVGLPLFATLPLNRFFVPAFPAFTGAMAFAIAERPAIAPRIVLLMATLGGVTLLYYGCVDMRIAL